VGTAFLHGFRTSSRQIFDRTIGYNFVLVESSEVATNSKDGYRPEEISKLAVCNQNRQGKAFLDQITQRR
jgi:hypothetical protein